jgi:hypothetical protein
MTNSTADISAVCVVQCVTDTLDSGEPEVSCILVENGTEGTSEVQSIVIARNIGMPDRSM